MEFNLADLFECVADQVPDRDALSCSGVRVTFGALDQRMNRLGNALLGAGLSTGDHVGLYMYNCVEFLEVMLACYKVRAVPININYRYVRDELAYLFDDADLKALVYQRELRPQLEALGRALRVPLLIEVDGGDEASAEGGDGSAGTVAGPGERDEGRWARAGIPRAPVNYEVLVASGSAGRDFQARSANDHYILYTGGTTGLPKGVVWRQEDIFFATLGGGNPGGTPIERPEEIARTVPANRAQRIGPFLPRGDPGPPEFVSLSLGPLMHASGQWSALGTLLGGGRVVLYPYRQMDMARVLELVERERVSMLTLVGDASGMPLVEELQRHPGRWDTSSLRLLGSGGSILSSEVKDQLLSNLPSVLAISEAIGSSEAPVQGVAIARPSTGATTTLKFTAREVTIVVDDDLRPITPGSGTVGRLATRGRVPLGYYNDVEKSAQTFVEIGGVRWSLPGDMASIDADGTIRLLGRGSLCINSGGEKVYPEEVEATLKSHPKVADAVVVGSKDRKWGERVVGVVQPAQPGDPPRLDELVSHCRAHLAGYKVPRAMALVAEVRRSPSGKPDYGWAVGIAASAKE